MAFVILFAIALGVGYVLHLRSQVLFRITIHDGKQTVTRGHVPSSLLSDFAAVVGGVTHGELSAYKQDDGARLSIAPDIDAGVAQRLRNIFGLYPVARLRAQQRRAKKAR